MVEAIEWIKNHAPLEDLCEVGGWPDGKTVHIDICNQSFKEWTVNIAFDEFILEISECDLTRHSRCGKFSISFNASGQPEEIRLLYPM